MATDRARLADQAIAVQHRLEEQGLREEAQVVEQLLKELVASQPEKLFYTTTQAAQLVGVSGQTIKNWVARGILKGHRLGGRVVIPRQEMDEYRALAEASKGLDPLPEQEEINEAVRAGRRRFSWPKQGEEPQP